MVEADKTEFIPYPDPSNFFGYTYFLSRELSTNYWNSALGGNLISYFRVEMYSKFENL